MLISPFLTSTKCLEKLNRSLNLAVVAMMLNVFLIGKMGQGCICRGDAGMIVYSRDVYFSLLIEISKQFS